MWDIFYLIDSSSSMKDQHTPKNGRAFVKIEGVAKGLVEVSKRPLFPSGSRLGVGAFRARTKLGGLVLADTPKTIDILVPLAPPSPSTTGIIRERLGQIETGGATPTGQAIREALEMFRGIGDGARIRKLIVVTDGRPNVGSKQEFTSDKKVASQAIVDAVGLGARVGLATLEAISAPTGGTASVADTLEELVEGLEPGIPIPSMTTEQGLSVVESVNKELQDARTAGEVTGKRQAEDSARYARSILSKELMEVRLRRQKLADEVTKAKTDLVRRLDSGGLTMKEYADGVWLKSFELQTLEAREKSLADAVSGFVF